MITVKRKLDDGNGNVHIVQQEEYESLRSLLKVINDNLNLQMNVDTQPADLQDYLENSDLIGDVFEWVTGYIADTDVQMGIIGNPNGYGNITDEFEIWDGSNLIAKC
jgi:hypothetical protein